MITGSCFIQHLTNGVSPRMEGSRYTIPQRLTVAGEATAKSCTSNIIVISCTGSGTDKESGTGEEEEEEEENGYKWIGGREWGRQKKKN